MLERPASAPSDVRLRAFVDAVFDAYYDWHIQTDHMEMSSRMDALLRLKPGTLSRTFDGWLGRVHPDDREEALLNNQRAAERGGVYEGEYRMRRGDGSFILVRDRGVILRDEDGLATHMIGAIRDITREREAERVQREAADLYRTLFAQAVNPAYQIAGDGRFLDANDAGLAFLAIERTQLLHQNVAALWGEDALVAVKAALAGEGAVATLDLELHIGDALKALTVTLLPCRLGGATTCFALATDITEHKALQRALEASGESLRRQAAALEDANTALRVILDQRNKDRAELERTVVTNAQTMIVPLLERLKKKLASTPEAIYADAAIQNLNELVSPFARSLDALAGSETWLSVREREIANLIRAGRSSSEIAEALFISPATVAFHRKNLRRKFGLAAHGPSLAAHLARLPGGQSRPPA
jgi:PAS domain-containing protein/DNA-binding CsgD family transcriptional regulator